jgi:acetaldehyde dehydrogenase / alcohol dehydrogenase
MTIGTGFFGRSSVAENLHPSHLVQWTRLAYNRDPAEPFGDFAGLDPWQAGIEGPVPPYPLASNQRERRPGRAERGAGAVSQARSDLNGFRPDAAALRAEIRRLILEELSQLAGG